MLGPTKSRSAHCTGVSRRCCRRVSCQYRTGITWMSPLSIISSFDWARTDLTGRFDWARSVGMDDDDDDDDDEDDDEDAEEDFSSPSSPSPLRSIVLSTLAD